MCSDSLDTIVNSRAHGAVRRLLDPAFGFFVWAAHFLTVYVTTALACVMGLDSRAPSGHAAFVMFLVAVTIAATLLVARHGLQRYRHENAAEPDGFLEHIAVGQDALAAAAILYQLFPIVMVPLCQ
jgi:hypothetical protein